MLHRFAPTVQNSGLEGFTVEFAWSECGPAYGGIAARLCGVARPTPVTQIMIVHGPANIRRPMAWKLALQPRC